MTQGVSTTSPVVSRAPDCVTAVPVTVPPTSTEIMASLPVAPGRDRISDYASVSGVMIVRRPPPRFRPLTTSASTFKLIPVDIPTPVPGPRSSSTDVRLQQVPKIELCRLPAEPSETQARDPPTTTSQAEKKINKAEDILEHSDVEPSSPPQVSTSATPPVVSGAPDRATTVPVTAPPNSQPEGPTSQALKETVAVFIEINEGRPLPLKFLRKRLEEVSDVDLYDRRAEIKTFSRDLHTNTPTLTKQKGKSARCPERSWRHPRQMTMNRQLSALGCQRPEEPCVWTFKAGFLTNTGRKLCWRSLPLLPWRAVRFSNSMQRTTMYKCFLQTLLIPNCSYLQTTHSVVVLD